MKEYEGAISNVQVLPLDDDEGLPVHQIYGPVLVEEDLTALKKTRRPDEVTDNKSLSNIKDMFYVRNNLARRIFLKGEAGHGKTVFCLKLVDTWSKGKTLSNPEGNKHSGETAKVHSPSRTTSKSLLSKITHWFTTRTLSAKPAAADDDDAKLRQSLSVYRMVFYVPLRACKTRSFICCRLGMWQCIRL